MVTRLRLRLKLDMEMVGRKWFLDRKRLSDIKRRLDMKVLGMKM